MSCQKPNKAVRTGAPALCRTRQEICRIVSAGMVVVLGGAMVVCATSRIASADDPSLHALLIGVNAYQDPKIPDLAGTGNDLAEMRAALGRIGYGDVVELRDERATKAGIVDGIGALEKRSKAGDAILVYFSGNGTAAPRPGREPNLSLSSAFVPVDARPDDLATLLFDVEVEELLARLTGRRVVWVTDVSYVDAPEGPSRDVATSRVKYASVTGEPSTAPSAEGASGPRPVAAEGLVRIHAAQDGQAAREIITPANQPMGGLTYHLVRGMEGRADRDRDGLVTYPELYTYVDDAMRTFVSPQLDHQLQMLPHPITRGVEIPEAAFWATKRLSSHPPRPKDCGQISLLLPDKQPAAPVVEEALQKAGPTARLSSTGLFSDGSIVVTRSIADGVEKGKTATIRGTDGSLVTTVRAEDDAQLASGLSRAVGGMSLRKRLVECLRNDYAPFEVDVVEVQGKRSYPLDSKVHFKITSERSGHLVLLNLDESGGLHVLLPNPAMPEAAIRAGEPVEFPGAGTFEFFLEPPTGQEVIKALVTTKPLRLPSVEKQQGKAGVVSFAPLGGKGVPSAEDVVTELENALAAETGWADSSFVFWSVER